MLANIFDYVAMFLVFRWLGAGGLKIEYENKKNNRINIYLVSLAVRPFVFSVVCQHKYISRFVNPAVSR